MKKYFLIIPLFFLPLVSSAFDFYQEGDQMRVILYQSDIFLEPINNYDGQNIIVSGWNDAIGLYSDVIINQQLDFLSDPVASFLFSLPSGEYTNIEIGTGLDTPASELIYLYSNENEPFIFPLTQQGGIISLIPDLSGSIGAISGSTQSTFGSLRVIVYAIIGLLVTFWLISQIVGIFPKQHKKHYVKPQKYGKTIVLGD